MIRTRLTELDGIDDRYLRELGDGLDNRIPPVARKPAPPILSSEVDAALTRSMEKQSSALHALADAIGADPETAFEERRTVSRLVDYLARAGIQSETGSFGLETAARATIGTTGPCVAVFSEIDALPGIGHGCGHNLIAAMGVGAFVALSEVLGGIGGSVHWLASPAEEGWSGKQIMIERGALDGVDAAVMCHPFSFDAVDMAFLGRRTGRIVFTGAAAHASTQPFMGRNAQDAVSLAYQAIGLFRQQLPPSDRLLAVMGAGHSQANVISAHAELHVNVRSSQAEGLAAASERIEAIARGAGEMTGCGAVMIWDETPGSLPLRSNSMLSDRWARALAERGAPPLDGRQLPLSFSGSTDFGNVSHLVPGIHPTIRMCARDIALHTAAFERSTGTPAAHGAITDAAYGIARVAAEYLVSPSLRAKVQLEFDAAGGAIPAHRFFTG